MEQKWSENGTYFTQPKAVSAGGFERNTKV